MSNENKTSSSDDLFLIIIVIMALLFAIWYFVGNEIKYLYLYYKIITIKLISIVYSTDEINKLISFIEKTPIQEITLKDLGQIGNYVNSFFTIPLVAFISYRTYNIYNNLKIHKFSHKHSMKSLAIQEVKNWKYIAPVINRDLVKEPLYKGRFAMAKKPSQYAIENNLLSVPNNLKTLDKDKAIICFQKQLGKPISSYEQMKPQEKAIFLILVAVLVEDNKSAMDCINNLAEQSSKLNRKTMPSFQSTKQFEKYLSSEKVKQIINSHSFAYTMIIDLYIQVKKLGVLPSSYFVWLKPRDRKLWYVLNCVGRKVSFVEVAGIFSHYKTEEKLNQALIEPYVKPAVDGLEIALAEVK